jgi:hypothetical protein
LIFDVADVDEKMVEAVCVENVYVEKILKRV